MTAEYLRKVLDEHAKWLSDPSTGARAVLQGADLQGADLQGADLRRADLRVADLRWADLRRADLRVADLRWADLRRADLRWADLWVADLQGADLRGADLGVSGALARQLRVLGACLSAYEWVDAQGHEDWARLWGDADAERREWLAARLGTATPTRADLNAVIAGMGVRL